MARQTVHILHLDEGCLNWARLGLEKRRLELEEHGGFESGPGETAMQMLERWAVRLDSAEDPVYLYDSRPHYFTFSMPVPAGAERRREQIVRLRIRQELGVDESSMVWASERLRPEEGREAVLTVVARPQALEDLQEWRRTQGLKRLWVGADVVAVAALARKAALPLPAVVTNVQGRSGWAYVFGETGSIRKSRIARGAAIGDWVVPELTLNGAQRTAVRVHFGMAGEELSAAWPEWGELPEHRAPQGETLVSGAAGRMELKLESAGERLDPVLLGGAIQLSEGSRGWLGLGAPRPAMASLQSAIVEEAVEPKRRAAGWFEEFGEKLRVRPLAIASVGLAGLLVVSVIGVVVLRGHFRERLAERAEEMQPATAILASQEQVLRRIAGDRAALTPVFGVLMEAMPQGVFIENLTIDDDGGLRIQGKAPGRPPAIQFFQALRDSELLTEVNLPDIQPGEGGMSFQLTGQIRDRGQR